MPMCPLVSVVIPTYNRAHVLCDAIESVLAQTYRNFEVIVVDDASTDSTDAVLARYGDRIRALRRSANGGASAARNEGLRCSKGELLCFLDSDDLYLPDRLQVGAGFLSAHAEYGAAYTDMLIEELKDGPRTPWVSGLSALPSGRIFQALLETKPYYFTNTPSITVRREVMDAAGGFDESLTFGEDAELWWRIAREAPIAHVAGATCVARRAWRLPAAPSRIWADYVATTQKVLRSYRALTAQERRAALLLHCYNLRTYGRHLAAEGRRADAFRAWFTAIRSALGGGLFLSAGKTVAACALGGSTEAVARQLSWMLRKEGSRARERPASARSLPARGERAPVRSGSLSASPGNSTNAGSAALGDSAAESSEKNDH